MTNRVEIGKWVLTGWPICFHDDLATFNAHTYINNGEFLERICAIVEIKEKDYNDAVESIMNKRQENAMKHPDKLGAGAEKRKALPAKEKVGVVMEEYKRGTLHSGSGAKVTNPKQAVAIGLSEARKAGAKIPKKGK